MSREVRRVPLDWEHPKTHNPYGREQAARAWFRGDPPSRLHGIDERFVGLMGDYPDAVRRWLGDVADIAQRRGHSWTFNVEYHLTGYQGTEDAEPTVHPFYVWEDDETEKPIDVRDEDHLHELMTAKVQDEEPNPAHYMPVFDQPADSLGWCLYETVSEGTPVTPVFATAEELVDHLATVGQDRSRQPMRREAAETVVRQGGTFGTFATVGGRGYRLDEDADLFAAATKADDAGVSR